MFKNEIKARNKTFDFEFKVRYAFMSFSFDGVIQTVNKTNEKKKPNENGVCVCVCDV